MQDESPDDKPDRSEGGTGGTNDAPAGESPVELGPESQSSAVAEERPRQEVGERLFPDEMDDTLPTFEDDAVDGVDQEESEESTVEALTPDAFRDDSAEPSIDPLQIQDLSDIVVASRHEDEVYLGQVEGEIALAKVAGLDQEQTTVSPLTALDGSETKAKRVADRAEPSAAHSLGEPSEYEPYGTENTPSEPTAGDRRATAVVSLADLARREEERLRRSGPEADRPDVPPWHQPIPVGQLVDVLRAARSVEEVARILVEIVSNLIPRVLLLWERRGWLFGFASRGMELTEVELLTIEVPRAVLQQMAGAELDLDAYQGPPAEGELVELFFDILGHRPAEVLLIPVQVTARDRWLIYADNRDQALPELELRLLEVVASRAGARADWLLDRQSIW